jgi:hypothetical protein
MNSAGKPSTNPPTHPTSTPPVSTTNSLNFSEPNHGTPPNPQIPIGIVWKRVGCVLEIEPNEHQISHFQGKYSYHTDHPENPVRPNSPNVLPMSRVMLGCGILRFCESQYFSGELRRTVGLM